MNPDPANAHTRVAAYWRRTTRITALLLCVWFLITFGVVFFARDLSELSFFGWSLSYYMAAQGAIFIYLAITGVYAWYMARLDKTLEGGDDDGK